MDIKVEVGSVTLDTIVGEHRIYDDETDGYTTEPVTMGMAVAKQIFEDLRREPRYGELKNEVMAIRKAEIQSRIQPVIDDALSKPIERTNSYGEPQGGTTTLTELIIAEVRAYLAKRDGYGSEKPTLVQKFVSDAVEKVVKKELAEAIVEEKNKVVAAVRAKAADLIAAAVKEGIGR